MPLVNVLQVQLQAATGAFQAGIRQAQQSLNALGGSLNSTSQGLNKFFERNRTVGQSLGNLKNAIAGIHPAAALGVAAVAGLGVAMARGFKDAVALGDELLKISQRTGISVEALSELKFVAEQNNTSFADLQIGLRFLQRAQVAAINGSKAAADAFDDVGLSVKEIKGLKTEELFERVADGIAATSDAAQRTSKSVELFGRGAGGLVPLLSKSGKGIRDAREEAREFGATISTTFAQQADVFGDNLGKLSTLTRAMGIQVAQALLPHLNTLVTTLFPLAKELLPLVAKALEWVIFGLSKAAIFVQRFILGGKQLIAHFKGQREEEEKLGKQIEALDVKLFESKTAFAERSQAMLAAVPATQAVTHATEEATSAVEALTKEFDELQKKLEGGVGAIVGVAEKLGEMGLTGLAALDSMIARLRELARTSEEARRALTGVLEVQERARREAIGAKPEAPAGGLFGAMRLGRGPQVQPPAAAPGEAPGILPVPELKVDVDPFLISIQEVKDEWESAFQSMTDLANEAFQGFATLADNFAGALTSGADLAKIRFGDFFKQLLKDLLRAIIRALILKTIMSFFGGIGFGGLMKQISGFLSPAATTLQENPLESALLGRLAIGRRELAAAAAPAGGGAVGAFKPTVVVNEATPRTWIEITDRHVIPRMRTRLRTMGESDFVRD